MTKSTITRERLQELAAGQSGFNLRTATHEESQELARIALAAMDSEPVAYIDKQWTLVYYVPPMSMGLKIGDRLYRHAQPAPVVPDEMLCEFYEVANWPDLVRELVKHVEQLQDSAKRNVKPWEDTFPETLLPAYIDRIKQADEACRAAMLQAGNSPQSMKCKTADELLACVPRNTGRSREHFISLCNEFWNWSEMDLVCADEKGYEPTMEWNGTKFTHRVTQALWRMYQAAPVNSPVIPDGYVMVPKEMTDEIGEAIAMQANCCGGIALDIYDAMIAAAPHDTPALNSLQSVDSVTGGWIPVSERMPEVGDIVLTAMGGAVNVGEMECSAANCRFFTSVISGRELPATYWMPLPAAPQEAQGE
ncbi:DUF551 domain-containing protein [Klebsiella grimontii]|uniref:DUF551 domain-containing protein n=3 Tax=Klebsiella grimontii TaxID=2058152 RepID=UPI001024ABEF|nr:DUF551 domain-containing protein [Klebsiella grimontii]